MAAKQYKAGATLGAGPKLCKSWFAMHPQPTPYATCESAQQMISDTAKKSVVKLCFRIRYSKRVIYLNIPSVLMVKMVPRGGTNPLFLCILICSYVELSTFKRYTMRPSMS